MIILNVLTKSGTITVKVNGVFVTLIWVEGFTSGAKASNGHHIENSRRQHPTRKLESISRAFLEVQ